MNPPWWIVIVKSHDLVLEIVSPSSGLSYALPSFTPNHLCHTECIGPILSHITCLTCSETPVLLLSHPFYYTIPAKRRTLGWLSVWGFSVAEMKCACTSHFVSDSAWNSIQLVCNLKGNTIHGRWMPTGYWVDLDLCECMFERESGK